MSTPRTDSAKCRMNICMTSVELDAVSADFSRQLEEELAAASARIAELESQLEAHTWTISPAMAQATIDAQAKRIAELDEYITTLYAALSAYVNAEDWTERLEDQAISALANAEADQCRHNESQSRQALGVLK